MLTHYTYSLSMQEASNPHSNSGWRRSGNFQLLMDLCCFTNIHNLLIIITEGSYQVFYQVVAVVVGFLRCSSVFRSIQCQRVLKHCKSSESVKKILILLWKVSLSYLASVLVTASCKKGTDNTQAQGKFQKVVMKLSKRLCL